MKNDNFGLLFWIVVWIVFMVLAAVSTKAIVNSDLPTWLKIMLLR